MKLALIALPLIVFASAASAEPVKLEEANLAFESQIAQRYPLGAKYIAAKADLEANGFSCSAYGGGGDAPTQECVRSSREGECSHEWAVELRERDGVLRTPASGSVAKLCVGAILPAKKSSAYQQDK
ncbi:MAG: hypothetical protein WDN76_11115 [Alphaproteobacteria bacterium]